MRLGGTLGSQGLEMSKPLLNGSGTGGVNANPDAAATMVAAIHDHLASCLKSQENSYANMEIKEERCSGGYSCDFDHMYASMTEHDSAAVAVEVRHLKDLLLLHLDLIQQQSEQLVNKDKQLQNLRQENEMLRQRLERMDRRVTLHTNKRVSGETSAPVPGTILNTETVPSEVSSLTQIVAEVPGHGNEEDEGSTPQQPFLKVEGSLSPRGSPLTVSSGSKQQPPQQQPPPPPPPQQQQQQQLALPEQRASRSRKSSWSSDTGTATSRKSTSSATVMAEPRETRSHTSSPLVTPQTRRLRTSARRTASDTEVVPTNVTAEVEHNKGLKISTPVALVKTPVFYFCPGESLEVKQDNEVSTQALLEVPSWRIKAYTSCYSMEGTENLEDEVFLKRHQRLELDERRRKRWDIQRLREQRQYEKLRQRQSQQQGIARKSAGANKSKKSEQVAQAWPNPENVMFIEVDEFLPVTAFGVPVPAFTPMIFELPWVTEIVDEESEKKGKKSIKQEPADDVEMPPAPPPPSPDLPPPPPPTTAPKHAPSKSALAARNNYRRRSRPGNHERRRTSNRRR